MALSKTQQQTIEWLANSKNTGISSETMAYWLAFGVKSERNCLTHPHDHGDFGRCLGLLDAAPLLRRKLDTLSHLSDEWGRISMYWYLLEDHYHKPEFLWFNSLLKTVLDGEIQWRYADGGIPQIRY